MADENKTQTQQSREPDVLSEMEKINKQKEELKQKIAENNAKMEARKKELETKKENAGALYKIGVGTTKEARYRSLDIDEDLIEEEKKKTKPQPKGDIIDLNALKDQGKYEQDKEMLGMAGAQKSQLEYTAEAMTWNAWIKAEQAKQDAFDIFVKGVKSKYFTSKGELDFAQMESRVDEKVKKPNTSSKALDELKAQGATQIDAPEIPPEDKGALVDMIVSGFADIAKSIGGMVSGDAATSVAIAGSQTAGEISGERVQAMIARGLANYEQRKEKIRLLNAELMAKHKGDIVAYTAEFEQRASAEERAYQNLRLQSLDMEYNRAMKVIGISEQMRDQIHTIAMERNKGQNLEQANRNRDELSLAMHKENYDLQVARFNAEMNNAKMMAEKLQKQKRMYVETLVNGIGNQLANIYGVGNNSAALSYALNDIDMWKGDETKESEAKIVRNGADVGYNYFNRVRQLVANGKMKPEEGANAIRVANTMAMGKYLPKTNMNDEEIIAAGQSSVSISPDADADVGRSLPMFSRVDNRTNVYFLTTLNNLVKTMYEQGANNYNKMPSSERGANPMPASFPWGVTE